jgi:hypothetical protein
MCECVCASVRVRARAYPVTAATAAYDDAEPEVSARQRLDICSETEDDAGGEDSSECACAGADAEICEVQNSGVRRSESNEADEVQAISLRAKLEQAYSSMKIQDERSGPFSHRDGCVRRCRQRCGRWCGRGGLEHLRLLHCEKGRIKRVL